MSYFSRLTDIVTCNLQDLLARENDPQSAIGRIVAEMEEGFDGAQISVRTAQASVSRLQTELTDHQARADHWYNTARVALQENNDTEARAALLRKGEVDDLIAGLKQQLSAAEATREQLATTMRALEARLTEARRKLADIGVEPATEPPARSTAATQSAPVDNTRAEQVEAELEALRRSLQSPG